MDNGDVPKSPFDTHATTRQSSDADDDVSKPRDVANLRVQLENSDEDNSDSITINTEDDSDGDIGDDVTIHTTEEEDDDGDGVQRLRMDESDTDDDSQGHRKKRKMKALLSNYEFAPRVPNPSAPPKPSTGGRNPLTDWTEPETFVLLNAWGEQFLKQGRKSLRSEMWHEVTERVNRESRIARTETQCKNRLDTLKKKYKKDKAMFGNGNNGSGTSSWVYFTKMDSLLSPPKEQRVPLSRAVDLGEYVSGNPRSNPDRRNDSPDGESDDGLPPKRAKLFEGMMTNKPLSSFEILAYSINRFSEAYKKIEKSGNGHLGELEKIRVGFNRELEMEKKKIMERAKDEIEMIRMGIV